MMLGTILSEYCSKKMSLIPYNMGSMAVPTDSDEMHCLKNFTQEPNNPEPCYPTIDACSGTCIYWQVHLREGGSG